MCSLGRLVLVSVMSAHAHSEREALVGAPARMDRIRKQGGSQPLISSREA
jgi:hypothetical protein